MTNMTLSVPEGLFKEMNSHTEIKWSDVARQAFQRKVAELHWMDKVLEKSKLSEADAERIGHKIKAVVSRRFSQ